MILSYASQDAEPAKRICDAFRAAGIEVWFDQRELHGGDACQGYIGGHVGSLSTIADVGGTSGKRPFASRLLAISKNAKKTKLCRGGVLGLIESARQVANQVYP